jgi:hypothetical protein
LVSYGIDTVDLHKRATTYVDRILKGKKPVDLPVQAPTKDEVERPRIHNPRVAHRHLVNSAQELYGQARNSASEIADQTAAAARKTATSFEIVLRNTIETQPYTAVFVALGVLVVGQIPPTTIGAGPRS